jgi:hypothetical protein
MKMENEIQHELARQQNESEIKEMNGFNSPPLPSPMFAKEADQAWIPQRYERLIKEKNEAYKERNKVVAAMAVAMQGLGYDVYRSKHVPDADSQLWSSDWQNVLFIESPYGQMSWHFHDSEIYLLQVFPFKENKWDGHTAEDKYLRLLAFTISRGMQAPRTRVRKVKSSEEKES